MAWWRKKVVSPARRAWAAVSTRVRATKTGSGGSILKLHEDVQTCGYKDVQVMFEILRSELEVSSHGGPKHQQQRKQPVVVGDGGRAIEIRRHGTSVIWRRMVGAKRYQASPCPSVR